LINFRKKLAGSFNYNIIPDVAFIPGAKERVVIRKELGLSNVLYE